MKTYTCGQCTRKEHKTKDGVCHYCWGTGIRKGYDRESCHECCFIYPTTPLFCIHEVQLFSCNICKEDMREIGLDVEKHRKWALKTTKSRLGNFTTSTKVKGSE